MTTTIRIEGMSCHHCVKAVRDALLGLGGVAKADVSLEAKSASVEYDEGKVTPDDMKKAIEEEGYEVA